MAKVKKAKKAKKAKKTRKKPVFKCKTCGKQYGGGRALGTHYAEIPAHRPAGKPEKPRKPKRKTRRSKTTSGFSAQLKVLLDSIDAEINTYEQAIKNLKKKKEQLKKLDW